MYITVNTLQILFGKVVVFFAFRLTLSNARKLQTLGHAKGYTRLHPRSGISR
jgi:hypothetical protein